MKENYKIKGMANVKVLEEFQNLFFKLTGLYITIVDKNGEFITSRRGVRKFCLLMKDNNLEHKCRKYDFIAAKKVSKLKKPLIYKCFAGLTEIVSPIIINKRFLGCALAGQIRTKGKSAISEELKKNLSSQQFKKLRKEFNNVPELKKSKIRAASELLYLMIKYIFVKEFEVLIMRKEYFFRSTAGKIVPGVIKYIKNNFNHKIYLKNISKKLYISPSYLSRIFREETGFTISNFIKKLRLEKAAELLKEKDIPIKEIAYSVGYEDLPYFYRAFKSCYKKPPHSFRETYRSHGK